MSSHSAHERQELVEALRAAGPTAPTLCEGWTAHDLAAHLVTRERRPDAAAIAAIPFTVRRADTVRRTYLQQPFAELVELVRTGPPRLSLFALPGVDARANLGEHFVHCEDVRRGAPGWEPRELTQDLEQALWRMLAATAKFALRKSPVPIRLVRPDGAEIAIGSSGVPVRVSGEVSELVLHVFGRTGACRVEIDGPEEAVERFRTMKLGF
jgi:uncharacterized protein (TIGR03085 family)